MGRGLDQAVASRVDQIATMTYDSLMPLPALYRLRMREQVRGIGRSLAQSDVALLIGIPVSRERTLTHKPKTGALTHGLAGLCAGLLDTEALGAERLPEGVAMYAAWEAEPADWEIDEQV